MAQKITTRGEDYSRWYTEVVLRAELADYAPVKGCMVIRPYGYALWERMQAALDRMIKETGHRNAYFPLLIPESFLKKEAEHVEGFAPECAVVTHVGGKKLEENLVIRPTSETIIYAMFAKWIQSYRDLPLLINQWANIVRWEMRTRLFLRTTEFLWQEGHTAHATSQEAEEEALRILDLYRDFAENWMALPVIAGRKSEAEKFAGADHTYSIEAMMQDRKALQAGTSHHLGQNFARAFEVTFQTETGSREYVWSTSWGVSTRLIGALVMAHGDDVGLVLPPRLAPVQVVLVPIWTSEEERARVAPRLEEAEKALRGRVLLEVDRRVDLPLGRRFYAWEERGVPVRIEIGPKDVDRGQAVVARRDTGAKTMVPLSALAEVLPALLDEVQGALYARAKAFLEANSRPVDDYGEFREIMEGDGGFLNAFWCGEARCETQVKEETKATIRAIPFEVESGKGRCLVCGGASTGRVVYAKAY